MPVENVRCIYLEGAGCYGRNGHEDAAADAALLAKAVGKPVRVQWSRADEHGWDPKGPPTLIDLRAALDAQGNVMAWEVRLLHSAADAGGFRCRWSRRRSPACRPRTTSRPATSSRTRRSRTSCQHQDDLPPARDHAVPAVVDPHAGADAEHLRQRVLHGRARRGGRHRSDRLPHQVSRRDKRGLEVLERLAALSKWEKRPVAAATASGNVARGAACRMSNMSSSAPMSASSPTWRSTGRPARSGCRKFYVAHDCGQIINPDGLRNQIEGNVIQTVSRTLFEEVKFDRSQVTSLDWESYPILTFPDVPEIVIDLIDRPNEKPWGAGEPAAAVVPSAIANAVFDATGVRLRSVPFTPAKVKAALQAT